MEYKPTTAFPFSAIASYLLHIFSPQPVTPLRRADLFLRLVRLSRGIIAVTAARERQGQGVVEISPPYC